MILASRGQFFSFYVSSCLCISLRLWICVSCCFCICCTWLCNFQYCVPFLKPRLAVFRWHRSQFFQFSTPEKRSNSTGHGCRCRGGCLFNLSVRISISPVSVPARQDLSVLLVPFGCIHALQLQLSASQ